MDRARITLDGPWQFWTDPQSNYTPTTLDDTASRAIGVPAPWQSQGDDLRTYSGPAWYRRTVSLPPAWLDGASVVIGIDAADYSSQVWVNDQLVGENEGGFLPFEFEVGSLLRTGDNTITVRVSDPPEIFSEIPHGKQGWYGALSGIWQSVWLEKRSPFHIHSVAVFPEPSSGQLHARVSTSTRGSLNHHLVARLVDPQGQIVDSLDVRCDDKDLQISLQASDPLLWSPAQPHLYRLDLQLQYGAEILDFQSKCFGYRTIEARDGKLYLNGKLLYLRAALDQDYYPGTIYTTPSEAYLEDEFIKAKELGLNCLRCHIKPADPRYYELADRMGILIWTEIPSWGVLNDRSKRLAREMFEGILKRDGHHPSIIIWTIVNEDWGTDLVNQPSHRRWLREMYHWVKQTDPTRLVVDNSPCIPNFHVESDLEDYHFYRGIPDRRREWDAFLTDFAKRRAPTYSPNGDAVRSGKEPLILSEFGNWGLPDANALAVDGRDPWWFETGLNWAEGVVYPKGIQQRYLNLGLERVFGSWQALIEATQWQQFLALKYQIEAMRLHPEIQGYVVTELTDVHWEANGLLDMNRSTKAFHHLLKNVSAETVIVPVWEQTAYIAGDTVRLGLDVSHMGSEPLEDAVLSWSLEGGPRSAGGEVAGISMKPGSLEHITAVVFPGPVVQKPCVRRLSFKLCSAQGMLISENFLDLTFYPPRTGVPAPASQTLIYTPDRNLAKTLVRLGFVTTADLSKAGLVIAEKATPILLGYLEQGGRLLILADRCRKPGQIFPQVKALTRKGTPWEGDWASSFSWLVRSGALTRLAGGPLVDHAFDCVIPDRVLSGFQESEYATSVHSGLFVGWLHKPGALIAEKRYGKGKVVFNTFNLPDDTIGYDATATQLFDSLVELALV